MPAEWLSKLRLRVKTLWKRKELDRDLEDELAFHLAMRDSGLSADEARYAARRQFGNTANVKETSRNQWTFVALEAMWRDFTYALRTLVKAPTFAIVSIVTLALGIPASTAIFSVIESVLIEPFPYPRPTA